MRVGRAALKFQAPVTATEKLRTGPAKEKLRARVSAAESQEWPLYQKWG